ncbi:BamA/TamA family outer membrane protein [Mesonia aestuariivivens]|uniref:BamA/TamA family outer membrane protein n=1 Tax=Mesonia aestuariivivens TaxID=2796128 RepID=UPI0021045C80|nr:BamA/TamA family outer membrane protein [Mesonia aestuariivivens]
MNEKTDQQKIKFSANKIFNINKRNFIYIANHTGFINSENYLNNELFRTGGIQNLRGFQENSIITNFYTFFNTEYRYLLDQNLYTHSIFDFGKFENQNQKTDTNVYSIGIGLGLKTRSGLLKLLIANGKTNNQNFEFKNTKVHLSLTTQF